MPGPDSSPAELLAGIPLLSGMPERVRELVADQAEVISVAAGTWLFREGDRADAAYVVRAGRLEVIAEGPPSVLVRTVKRGEMLGELGVLQPDARRTASIRARRDSELVRLGRDSFEALLRESPDFAVRLVRALGAQLATSRAPQLVATPPGTIAVVGLDAGAPWEAIGAELGEALARHGKVATLREGDAEAIARAERDHDRLLLVGAAADPGESWTALCMREADLVVAVTGGRPDDVWLKRAATLEGCELIAETLLDDAVVAALAPREVQVWRDGTARARGVAATARRVAGRSLGVVLSGGGARALAHLGVVDELRAAGLPIDRVAGASMGSIVAAAVSLGLDPEDEAALLRTGLVDQNPSNDYTLPVSALLRGVKVRRILAEGLGDARIEELPVRFLSVSADLVARELVVHRTGLLRDAVYPSMAIPGIFPPLRRGARLLVDGGVLDNLPVETLARRGEGPIIASDVSGRPTPRGDRLRPRLRPLRRLLTGSETPLPALADTLLRTIALASSDTVAAALAHADLVIQPRIEGVGMLDWGALERVREAGRQAARAAIEANDDLVRAWTVG